MASTINGIPVDNRTYGNLDCNFRPSPYCMKKGDGLILLDPISVLSNPNYINIYYIQSMERNDEVTDLQHEYHKINTGSRSLAISSRRKNIINVDRSMNWAQDTSEKSKFLVYRFRFNPKESFEYVAECSNRGVCNNFEGLCECFNGYMGPACDEIAYLDL